MQASDQGCVIFQGYFVCRGFVCQLRKYVNREFLSCTYVDHHPCDSKDIGGVGCGVWGVDKQSSQWITLTQTVGNGEMREKSS